MKERSTELPLIFRYRLLWHILFWIAIYGAYVISYGGHGINDYASEARINLFLLPIRVFFTYIMLYILLPKYLLKQKNKTFISLSLLHALSLGFCIWIPLRWYHVSIDLICPYDFPVFHGPRILVNTISNYIIVLVAAMIKLFKWWYADQLYKVKIEKEKLESELKFLKAQIHPHFLFNTLNNLYALTLENSKEASDIVIKLSGLLDYMLYHSRSENVPLQKEIDILHSYIDLEKIRYGDRLDLSFKITGNTQSIKIAPLILLPFIENAFKHGASIDRGKSTICINLTIENKSIVFSVENSTPEIYPSQDIKNEEGIGLKNIRRQLKLLYPDSHMLNIEKANKSFKIELSLNCI